jgi:hypothetical protein
MIQHFRCKNISTARNSDMVKSTGLRNPTRKGKFTDSHRMELRNEKGVAQKRENEYVIKMATLVCYS